MDLNQIWFRGSSCGRNQLCRILWQSAQGLQFCRGSKFAISHWLGLSPLTQCWRYCAAFDALYKFPYFYLYYWSLCGRVLKYVVEWWWRVWRQISVLSYVDSEQSSVASVFSVTLRVFTMVQVTMKISSFSRGYICHSVSSFFLPFFLSYLGWHTLPSHASTEACLPGWPSAQPQGRD